MKHIVLLLLISLSLFFGGTPVVAVEVQLQMTPNKAFYTPGEPVTFVVNASTGAQVVAQVSHLDETLATLEAPVEDGQATLTWTPPANAPTGYGLDVTLLDADGTTLATESSAFDVLERWIQAPRYGFLSDFTPGRDDAEATIERLLPYHVNGLQFYDWQYRHETLLAPEEPYTDILGRHLSMETVNKLIDAAHARGLVVMPYTAIYGASPAFHAQHPDWAMFSATDKPYDFADSLLMIMDPTPGSPWATHLLNEFRTVLDTTNFDGIHIDQYGAPMRGLNAAGENVFLDDVFPAFINESAALVDEVRGEEGYVIFNLVRNWPLATVAPSNQDAVYIEVWDPYNHFLDLSRIIAQAQNLSGGKPVILAAYIHPERTINTRLANALIFASGGYHLELGEPNGVLADPYFPLYGQMDAVTQVVQRRYYDFLVRYENLLAIGTTDATAERAAALTIDGVVTGTRRSRDRVAVIVRDGASRETFSLVNLLGIDGDRWNEPLTQGPTPLHNLSVSLEVTRPVAQVWAATPDGEAPAALPLEYTQDGSTIRFSLPQLDYWTMLVVEYSA